MAHSDIRLRVREDRAGAMVCAAPWRLVYGEKARGCPVRLEGVSDADLDTGTLVHTLDAEVADDYRKLFHLRAEASLILYYGSCARPPMPSAVHVEIDAMRAATRELLCDAWPAVCELARLLRAHGRAEPALLARLPRGSLTLAELDGLFLAGLGGAVREPGEHRPGP